MIKKSIHKLEENEKNCYEYIKQNIFDLFPDTNLLVAGGSIRNLLSGEKIQGDIDIFHRSRASQQVVYNALTRDLGYTQPQGIKIGYAATYLKPDSTTIQSIYRVSVSFAKILDNFDFTICCCGISKNYLYLHDNFYEHLNNKQIVVNKFDKKTIFNRIDKYRLKGFTISDEEIEKIAAKMDYPKEEKKVKTNKYTPNFVSFVGSISSETGYYRSGELAYVAIDNGNEPF